MTLIEGESTRRNFSLLRVFNVLLQLRSAEDPWVPLMLETRLRFFPLSSVCVVDDWSLTEIRTSDNGQVSTLIAYFATMH